MKTVHLALIASILILNAFSVSAAEAPYSDNFTTAEQQTRRATRGPWIIENGTATCTQDNELYKKFKDHGPVTWYDLDFKVPPSRFLMNKARAFTRSTGVALDSADD
jgi:hypothetical protein